ncbi:MAG: nucleotidyltransferase domain-containing protein [Firmicutes bacterium]|nr:nucleotidyltransferase domain-containing protein [Bacillota bacterium]
MVVRGRNWLEPGHKAAVLRTISEVLRARPEIAFAYVHGSFVEEDRPFGDIDLAVYLDPLPRGHPMHYELSLEVALEEHLRYPTEVRVLNTAPLGFCYNVLRTGRLLFARDDDARVEFQTRTLDYYFDYAPLLRRCFREAFGS